MEKQKTEKRSFIKLLHTNCFRINCWLCSRIYILCLCLVCGMREKAPKRIQKNARHKPNSNLHNTANALEWDFTFQNMKCITYYIIIKLIFLTQFGRCCALFAHFVVCRHQCYYYIGIAVVLLLCSVPVIVIIRFVYQFLYLYPPTHHHRQLLPVVIFHIGVETHIGNISK